MSEQVHVETENLQRLWKSLVKLFPSWSLPIDWFFSPSSWRMVGVDMIAGQLHDARVRRASAQLQGASDALLESLSQIARLNEERATSLFRAIAVCYITLPIALAALLTEAAPDLLSAYVEDHLEQIAFFVVAAIVTPIIYFFGMWRAKQLAWTIDLYRAGGVTPTLAKKKA